MDILHRSIENFFEKIFDDLRCEPATKAYIIGIYIKYKKPDFDLSKDSVGLLFLQARLKSNFLLYQTLGDWIFFCNTIAPQHLNNASKDYYDNIAKLSYNSCYNLINRKWKLFEELSDNFNDLENQVKNKIKFINQ
jgi:hypothetical protein